MFTALLPPFRYSFFALNKYIKNKFPTPEEIDEYLTQLKPSRYMYDPCSFSLILACRKLSCMSKTFCRPFKNEIRNVIHGNRHIKKDEIMLKSAVEVKTDVPSLFIL